MRSVALALAVLAAPVHAAPRTVTLDEALAASTAAPRAVAARAHTAAAAALVAGAGAWPATEFAIGAARTSRLVATARLPLPVLGRERRARTAAQAEAAAVAADDAVVASELRRDAAADWLALYRAGAMAALADESHAQLIELARITAARNQAGDAADAEVATTVAAAARAGAEAERAHGEVTLAAMRLAGRLGWSTDDELIAGGALPTATTGAASSPAARAAKRHVDAATAAVAAAQAATRPALHLELEADALAPDGGPPDLRILVGVELPLFGRGHDQVAAARAAVASATADATAVVGEVATATAVARRAVELALRYAARHRDELVPAQERATALARAAYQAGAIDLASVIAAERERVAVRTDAVDAELAVSAAVLELAAAEGRL
ncbi:MAG: TolC family protein [Kofleriaceae bacterium]